MNQNVGRDRSTPSGGGDHVEEYVTLVDTGDRVVGRAEKMHAHREGLLHRAFSIMLYDSESRILLQRRHPSKYHSGGLWSNTACGHPRPDEPTLAAAERRLMEEMGVSCDLNHQFGFIYRAEVEDGLTEYEYDHVFTGLFDGDPTPDDSEVEGWKWVEPEELARDVARSPRRYTYWFRLLLYSLAGDRPE